MRVEVRVRGGGECGVVVRVRLVVRVRCVGVCSQPLLASTTLSRSRASWQVCSCVGSSCTAATMARRENRPAQLREPTGQDSDVSCPHTPRDHGPLWW